MVDGTGNARIMDFGLVNVLQDLTSVASTYDGGGYSPRWTAPEMIRCGTPASKESDVFSYAMVLYEARRRQIFDISATLPIDSGFLWESSIPPSFTTGSSDGKRCGWETSEAALSP